MATRPDSPSRIVIDNGTEVTILSVGPDFSYTIHSFSVITVSIRQCVFQFDTEGGVRVLDGFIQSNPSLSNAVLPLLVKLTSQCYIPVSYTASL